MRLRKSKVRKRYPVQKGQVRKKSRALPVLFVPGTIQGVVYLAGAGPGDPGLITLRASQLLREADAVVYDGLVNPLLLKGLKAELWNVSKHFPIRTANHGADQSQINRLLVKLARSGKKVVRLKGGDPFIFGRGGEEASFLKKNKICFEVVPGVSAGNAVPAYAGIPVTDRRFASSVTFVTSHEDPDKKNGIDWNAVARLGGTLVFFMGWKKLAEVSDRLIREGLSAKTPCAAIQWGTMPGQRVVEGELKNIAVRVTREDLRPPALIVVGKTAGLRRDLDWFGKKPLLGKRVLVTRPENQNTDLCSLLAEQGAEAIACPVIRIVPPRSFSALDQAIEHLDLFDWILFTSTNSAEYFFGRLTFLGLDARALRGLKVAAMGPATADFMVTKGVRADLIPGNFETAGLIQELKKRAALKGQRFLLPRTDIAPPELKKQLERGGARVTAVTAYRTLQDKEIRNRVRAAVCEKQPDYVLFASASSVRYFFSALPRKFWGKIQKRLVSIGPATTQALKDLGMKPCLEAREHTGRGLVEALIKKVRSSK